MDDRIREMIEKAPTEPGVYLMRNRKRKIIYIGKATNLRSRIRSYFSGGDPRPFVRHLSRTLGEIETVITRNAKEALLLENRLIKVHQPRYNVKLRDDKNYLSLRIDTKAEWPRVEVVRRQRSDGALYFGPYHSASAIRQTLRIVNRYFGLRTCRDSVLNNRSRPCLQYQIKRCPGPCVVDVDREAYQRSVEETVLFLQGRKRQLVRSLERRMKAASDRLEFELAAHYRDQIRDVERSLITQEVETVRRIDQDVIGLYREGDAIALELIFLRRGIVTGTRRFAFTEQEFPDEEVISSFVVQFYKGGADVPHEVVVPLELEGKTALEELLSELRGTKVRVTRPQRGFKKSLLETAQRTAEQAFREELGIANQRRRELEALQRRLRLTHLPRRIECFDISNLGDTAIVGSMAVFVDGEAQKAAYRTFRVRTVAAQDDFAAMFEVLSRRIRRSQENKEPWPDLIVIDGGKGQLSMALRALEDLGAHNLEVVALAKSRVQQGSDETGATTRSDERVFLPGVRNPIRLRPNTGERHLMERLRDEAHRVAKGYHTKLRRKRTLRSALDGIPGVGAARRKALLKHFGSVGRIRSSSPEELTAVQGISQTLARRIWEALN
jgi:excinuclease ABC subunit C